MNFSVLRFDTIDSTNTEAARQARLGADEGLCIVSKQQTSGRGRQGRKWTSPKDAGIYLSIVLRPKIETASLPLITLASAIAVHDVVKSLGLQPDIKWPNDVLVNEKKISGILSEAVETDEGLTVIVGIGINVTADSFPPELSNSATSIESETGTADTFFELESSLIEHFGKWYGDICDVVGRESIIKEWIHRSSYANGKEVKVTLASEMVTGVTDGLEPNGALRVRKDDGNIIFVQAGDVERLRPAAA